MKANVPVRYQCPYSRESLTLQLAEIADGEVVSGLLVTPSGIEYPIRDGIPQLIDFRRESLDDAEQRELAFYQSAAAQYDATMDWVFKSFNEDEDDVREAMIDQLRLPTCGTVLETGCGTCRDSIRIARRLGVGGHLYLQDLSRNMLSIGKERVDALRRSGAIGCQVDFLTGNAMTLPFPNEFFEAAFHFGGINVFADISQAVAEMARVVKTGGRVVFGDEGLAPWLRKTEYGSILMTSSSMYRHDIPYAAVPPSARDVSVRWMIGNAYYLVAFSVGHGTPPLDLDLAIVGPRGGTHRTRNFGALPEGVTPETKQRVFEAAARQGVSVHEWLEQVLSTRLAAESR